MSFKNVLLLFWVPVLFILWIETGWAEPRMKVTVCFLDIGFRPFTTPEKDGLWQKKLRDISQKMPFDFEFIGRPRGRCLHDAETNIVDALFLGYVAERENVAVFPKKLNKLRKGSAVGTPVFRVYRLKGTQVDWDGETFSNLKGLSVGVQQGLFVETLLRKKLIPLETTASAEHTLMKLISGRLAAAVINEEQFNILKERKSAVLSDRLKDIDKVEALPKIFDSSEIYLAFTKKFYANHAREVEAFWTRLEAEKKK